MMNNLRMNAQQLGVQPMQVRGNADRDAIIQAMGAGGGGIPQLAPRGGLKSLLGSSDELLGTNFGAAWGQHNPAAMQAQPAALQASGISNGVSAPVMPVQSMPLGPTTQNADAAAVIAAPNTQGQIPVLQKGPLGKLGDLAQSFLTLMA